MDFVHSFGLIIPELLLSFTGLVLLLVAAWSGDKGARELLSGPAVTLVDMDSDAVLKDIDTPEALS